MKLSRKLIAIVIVACFAVFLKKTFIKVPPLSYMNKSYYKDIHYSEELYKTFEKNYSGDGKFYVCIPEKDFDFFHQRFSKLKEEKIIKNIPILIKEESLLLNSEIADFKSLGGHDQQQVIKLVFWRQSGVKHYVTFDSDITLIRNFTDEIFYYPTTSSILDSIFKTRALKTVMSEANESGFSSKIDDFFSDVKAYEKTHNKYFVCGYGLWNSDILRDLYQFLQKTHLKNFVNAIKLAPVEMEWYGKYLYLYHPDKFFPQSPVVTGIQGFISSDDFSVHRTTQEICGCYCNKIKEPETIGIYLHYHTNYRSGFTLNDFMQDCKCS